MSFQIEFDEQDVRGQLQRLLLPWLEKSDAPLETLTAWLHGYGLPPVGHDEEPYVWVLRGLPVGWQRGQAREILTQRVARCLEREPDMTSFGRRPQEMMYNLLMLAAHLPAAEHLAAPLRKIFDRGELSGDWRGFDLRGALLSALIYNQDDDRLRPEWESLLEGKPHRLLPGSRHDGFAGMLWMPPGPGKSGTPAVDAIGWSLRRMADDFEQHHPRECRGRFRELLDRVQNTYPRSSWPRDLLLQAHAHQWPQWAVECLPSLSIRLESSEEHDNPVFLLWKEIARWLPKDGHNISEQLCGGIVLKVRLSTDSSNALRTFVSAIEEIRQCHPFEKSMYPPWPKMINNKMAEIEVCLRSTPGTPQELSHWVSQGRAEWLPELKPVTEWKAQAGKADAEHLASRFRRVRAETLRADGIAVPITDRPIPLS